MTCRGECWWGEWGWGVGWRGLDRGPFASKSVQPRCGAEGGEPRLPAVLQQVLLQLPCCCLCHCCQGCQGLHQCCCSVCGVFMLLPVAELAAAAGCSCCCVLLNMVLLCPLLACGAAPAAAWCCCVGLTWSPLLTRYSHRWLPTKPAPPVTSTRLRSMRGLVLMRVPLGLTSGGICSSIGAGVRWRQPLSDLHA